MPSAPGCGFFWARALSWIWSTAARNGKGSLRSFRSQACCFAVICFTRMAEAAFARDL
jgi:hypothetical protein